MVCHYEYSTYNSHHKVHVNLQASNMDAVKNLNYGLCWPTYSQQLTKLRIESLELRRLHLDLVYVYKILFGVVETEVSTHFVMQYVN